MNHLDAWIEREFSGHGVAIRGRSDPPIPGEPFMPMAVAKELTRRAVAEFAGRTAAHFDTVALGAAFDIEKIFEQLHVGGRTQLLAKIQCTVRDAMMKASC